MAAGATTFWLYILELANGHLYTGYSRDLARRYAAHLKGKGARTTRISPPVRIAACWRLSCTQGDALRLETAIKRRGRAGKLALIAEPQRLRELARRSGLAVRVKVATHSSLQEAEGRAADPHCDSTTTMLSRCTISSK